MGPVGVCLCSSWGEPLVWGERNKKHSAGECCQSCAEYDPAHNKDGLDCNGEREGEGRNAGRERIPPTHPHTPPSPPPRPPTRTLTPTH
jgi:hypothetical protein